MWTIWRARFNGFRKFIQRDRHPLASQAAVMPTHAGQIRTETLLIFLHGDGAKSGRRKSAEGLTFLSQTLSLVAMPSRSMWRQRSRKFLRQYTRPIRISCRSNQSLGWPLSSLLSRSYAGAQDVNPEGFIEPRFINDLEKSGFFEEMNRRYQK